MSFYVNPWQSMALLDHFFLLPLPFYYLLTLETFATNPVILCTNSSKLLKYCASTKTPELIDVILNGCLSQTMIQFALEVLNTMCFEFVNHHHIKRYFVQSPLLHHHHIITHDQHIELVDS
eukprot:961071_1